MADSGVGDVGRRSPARRDSSGPDEQRDSKRAYIQQYGTERSGTNYLKALVGRNFANVVLFDNRLGSKHDPFQEVSEWMRDNGIDSRAAFENLLSTDKCWRKRSKATRDPFEWVHQPIAYKELLGLAEGSLDLHYVVQIKHPLAFAVSINRWRLPGRGPLTNPPSVEPWDVRVTHKRCIRFNMVYRSYRPLVESGRAILVRYEDLLDDPIPILRRMQKRFALVAKKPALENVTETVMPRGASDQPFYRDYYENEEYLEAMPKGLRDSLTALMDWDLMALYGYRHPDEK